MEAFESSAVKYLVVAYLSTVIDDTTERFKLNTSKGESLWAEFHQLRIIKLHKLSMERTATATESDRWSTAEVICVAIQNFALLVKDSQAITSATPSPTTSYAYTARAPTIQ